MKVSSPTFIASGVKLHAEYTINDAFLSRTHYMVTTRASALSAFMTHNSFTGKVWENTLGMLQKFIIFQEELNQQSFEWKWLRP